MDSVKISELNELTTAKNDDLLPIVDIETGETKKIKASALGNVGGITGDTLPIGSMVPYGNENPPTNWLICDGSEISRFTYSDLFNVIGTSYGEGDGSTTFNLPNKKGKISVGLDTQDTDFNTIGKTGGEKTHALTVTEMPSHSHTMEDSKIYDYESQTGTGSIYASDTVLPPSWSTSRSTSSTGGGESHNNLQPYEVDNWIIKAFQSAGIVAEVEQNLLSNSTTNVPSVSAVKEAITTNITTDGNPVKTGRIIDGKEEYVKRIDFGALPNNASKEVSSGLVYLDIKIVEIDAVALNDSGTIFILPYIGSFTNTGSIILQLVPSNNNIRIATNTDRSNVNGYINIYFTYNNV